MIKVAEEVEVAVPIETAWGYLGDPSRLVECIPGAELTESRADGTHAGQLTVKFGPTRVKFQGEVSLGYDADNHVCRAKSRGRDQRGMSNANGEGVVTLSSRGNMATLIAVEGSFQLTGPLAPFAKTAGPALLRTLLTDFAVNLAEKARRDAGEADDESKPPVASSMSAGKLMLGVLKETGRGVFKSRKK